LAAHTHTHLKVKQIQRFNRPLKRVTSYDTDYLVLERDRCTLSLGCC
jgi:hypothetical protein